jgi:hypothetical protein
MTQPPDFAVPAEFFATLTEAERMELARTWRLTGALCERLWRMSEFQGPPPDAVDLLTKRSDLERFLRESMVARGWSDAKIERQLRKARKAIATRDSAP